MITTNITAMSGAKLTNSSGGASRIDLNWCGMMTRFD